MAENIAKSRGQSQRYKLNAEGVPAESGPFIGEIMEHFPNTRSARVKVYIELFSGPNKFDRSGWRDVSYCSPFFGTTDPDSPEDTTGDFLQNKHSYGMWFTPPDLGTKIVCFFANGDPNQGYYIGSVVTEDAHHMVPAIGSTTNFVDSSNNPYYSGATRLPVVEINDENPALSDSPVFFNGPKPVHNYLSSVLLQQGLLKDTVRGTIGSNSYRETPSTVFGLSTPGRPIFQGGYTSQEIVARLNQDANNPGSVPLESMKVIGRQGGHSIVLDDGDLSGQDQLVRIRTAKGHQILLSDSGDALHIIHANGQSWMELGAEGTIDLYASNSVNIRGGEINLHADRAVNINSNLAMTIASTATLDIETKTAQLTAEESLLVYSKKFVGVKSDGSLSLEAEKGGTWNGGAALTFSGGCISLNSGSAPSVPKTTKLVKKNLPDVTFESDVGWIVEQNKIKTVASRVPTHEPWPFHNTSTNVITNLSDPVSFASVSANIQEKINESTEIEITPILVADFEQQEKIDKEIGTLKPEAVTALVAQASKNVDQSANEISNTLGVGKFGMSAKQLETAGYLKAGTTDFYSEDIINDLSTTLQSPAVWSGKSDVNSLADFLGDSKLQDETQAELFETSLNELRSAGLVTGREAPSELGGVLLSSSKQGSESFSNWINNNSISVDESAVFKKDLKSGSYAVSLSEQKITEADKGYSTTSTTYSSTTKRVVVDEAVNTTLNTNKTDAPSYTRTAASRVRNTQTADLERQISNITNVEIPQAKAAYLDANPDKKFADFLRSTEYKALKAKRDGLQAELEAARRG